MLPAYLYVIYFFVGACFVSCGNCIYYRVLHGEDWVRGRSHCDFCDKKLHVWELVPVLSCLVLKGKCPKCGWYFGYYHAETECAGGMCAVLACMGLDGLWAQLVRLCIFGVLYCGISWISAHTEKGT